LVTRALLQAVKKRKLSFWAMQYGRTTVWKNIIKGTLDDKCARGRAKVRCTVEHHWMDWTGLQDTLRTADNRAEWKWIIHRLTARSTHELKITKDKTYNSHINNTRPLAIWLLISAASKVRRSLTRQFACCIGTGIVLWFI